MCNAFWSAPVSGTDSKGGTIVHEMSHFNVVAGTDDIVYGQSGAKSLALSNPAQRFKMPTATNTLLKTPPFKTKEATAD